MRTYASRTTRPTASTVPNSEATPPSSPQKKRPLAELLHSTNIPPAKRQHLLPFAASSSKPNPSTLKRTASQSSSTKSRNAQPTLTQLHFITSTSLTTCSICGLSYTKGAPEDAALHKAHCLRVQRGLEWGKDDEREAEKAGVVVLDRVARPEGGLKGRVISVRCDVGGKIGSKLSTLFETINLTLSAPSMTPEALRASKAYLFLTASFSTKGSISGAGSTSAREKIAGCVIAQRIETAFAVASSSPSLSTSPLPPSSPPTSSPPLPTSATTASADTTSEPLIIVDTALSCHPTPLPTPLGIPRLFVPTTYRRHGIATRLLDAAARTFVHGCPLDPRRGEVAFSQPTGAGKAVMESWGEGGVRIFQE